MKNVIFLVNGVCYGYAYLAEDKATLRDDKANDLLQKGVVAVLKEPYTPLPKKFPYRNEVVKAGFYSLESVEKADKNDTIKDGVNSIYSIPDLLKSYKTKTFFDKL